MRRGKEKDWSGLPAQWGAVAYTSVLSLVLASVLGRALGPDRFGVLAYATSLASILAVLQDGGFRTLLFREKASLRENGSRGAGAILRAGYRYLLAVTLGLLLLLNLLPLRDKAALSLALGITGMGVLSGFVSSILKGEGRFSLEAGWQALYRTLAAGAVFLALFLFSRSVECVLAAWFLGVLAAILSPLGMGTLRGERNAQSTEDLREARKACLAFLLIDAATLIYFRSDMVLLRYLGGRAAETGLYAAAYRILEGVILLATPVAHMFFRDVRGRWTGGREVRRFFSLGVGAMAVAGAGLALAGGLLGPPFLVLLFGSEFAGAKPVLLVLMPALVFVLPNYFFTQGALAFDMEWTYARFALLVGIFNIALNLVLIPAYGGVGAAWATFASEGLLGVLLGISLERKLREGAGGT